MVQTYAIRYELQICSRVITSHFMNPDDSIEVLFVGTNVVQADHADVGLVATFTELPCRHFVRLQNHDLICRLSRNDTLKDLTGWIGFLIAHS